MLLIQSLIHSSRSQHELDQHAKDPQQALPQRAEALGCVSRVASSVDARAGWEGTLSDRALCFVRVAGQILSHVVAPMMDFFQQADAKRLVSRLAMLLLARQSIAVACVFALVY